MFSKITSKCPRNAIYISQKCNSNVPKMTSNIIRMSQKCECQMSQKCYPHILRISPSNVPIITSKCLKNCNHMFQT